HVVHAQGHQGLADADAAIQVQVAVGRNATLDPDDVGQRGAVHVLVVHAVDVAPAHAHRVAVPGVPGRGDMTPFRRLAQEGVVDQARAVVGGARLGGQRLGEVVQDVVANQAGVQPTRTEVERIVRSDVDARALEHADVVGQVVDVA